MINNKIYAIHPGYVLSHYDTDLHYISVGKIVELHKLKRDRYIIWDENRPETYSGRRWENYIHIFANSCLRED